MQLNLLHRYSFKRINNRQLLKTLQGKEEIAPNEQILLFPQCFLLNQKIVSPFCKTFDIISLFAAELDEPKTGMIYLSKLLSFVKVFNSLPHNPDF